jgi:transcriptional regulator with XRE-family HTH domain
MSKNEMTRALASRLRMARQAKDISQPELASALGLSKQMISAWERGAAQMYAHQAVACARHLGIGIDWLLLGESESAEFADQIETRLPVLSAEDGAEFAAGRLPLASVRRCTDAGRSQPASSFALVVSDSSMAPVLEPGDIVLVNPEKVPQQGDLVVAACGQVQKPVAEVTTIIVRQIGFLLQTALPPLILTPVSPDWPIIRVGSSAEARILGVVVSLIRRLDERWPKEEGRDRALDGGGTHDAKTPS